MGGTTHRSPSDLCPLARICVIAVMPPLAHIIHECFCCNRGSAAATSRQAGSPLSPSTYCFKYVSVLRGSACLTRNAAPRFRNELS